MFPRLVNVPAVPMPTRKKVLGTSEMIVPCSTTELLEPSSTPPPRKVIPAPIVNPAEVLVNVLEPAAA